MRPSILALATCAAALAVAVPRPAHAQLLKRIGRAVVEKTTGDAAARAIGRDSASSGASTARTASGSVTTLEITPERLDAFVAGMQPLLAVQRRQDAHDGFLRRTREYEQCGTRVANEPTAPPSAAVQAELLRVSAVGQRLAQRVVDAYGASDTAAVRRLSDSSQVLTERLRELTHPNYRTQCGARPVAAAAPTRAEYDSARAVARTVGGMSGMQLGRFRERLGYYLLAPESRNDLTDAERAVIDARRAPLAPIVALMRSGSMRWTTWGDLLGG